MRSFCRLSLVLSAFLLSCPPTSQAQHPYRHENLRPRHRQLNNPYNTFATNHKRDAFTYFVDGQGACGKVNGPNDFIVALNSADFNGGAHCFDMITITIGQKTAQAQITDECSGCSPGGLDFSQGLFEYFASLGEGVLSGSWSYNSDITTSSSTPAPPSTSSTPTATTTTTMATTTSLSSLTSSSTATTSSPTPTTSTAPTSTSQGPQIIMQIDNALLELGVLLQASLKLGN